MFAGFFQDVFRMLRWVLWAWWNLMIISNEGMDFNDPKEFDDHQLFDDPSYSMIPAILWSQLFYDPQLFDDPKLYNYPQLLNDQLEVWTLIIQKPTVIPSSPMVYLTMSLEAMRAWKLRFLQYKLVQFHAWSVNQRFSQLSLKFSLHASPIMRF